MSHTRPEPTDRTVHLDHKPYADLRADLHAVCTSFRWVDLMTAARPYHRLPALLAASDTAIIQLTEADIGQALAGHPRIGDRGLTATTRHEQAGVSGTDTLAALAAANQRYEARFGHIYLVRADGRSGEELLAVLRGRLNNDEATERRVVRAELAAINRLRLRRLVDGAA
jgi:2-oxo-4-hydroxy-4-carboxy-5-ureidoimidazoline decarboxylase